jgi:hypothetical protein
MMKSLFTTLCLITFFNVFNTTAQVEQVIFQSIEVNDATMKIEFDLADPHEIVPWHHESKVLVETKINMTGTNLATLALLIKEGRYDVAFEDRYPVTTMRPISPNRSVLKNGHGETCGETISIKIYVPQGFIVKKPIIEPNLEAKVEPKGHPKALTEQAPVVKATKH